MTARTVPPDWRPVIGRDGGAYRLAFRGRDIASVAGEFTDVGVMLGQAAGTGVDHLLLSPWISLVPAEADTVTHDRDLLADLVRFAGAGQVLLGSDRPFDMGSDDPVGEVRALGLGTGEESVLGGTAARLLGAPGA